MRLRLGELGLDCDRRLLLRGQEEVHLGPKGCELLERLVRLRPRGPGKTGSG